MPRLLISAAHTLENPGEVFENLREADLTRKIVKMTLPYLQANGIEFQAVPLDLQLLKRIDWIRDTGYSKEQGDLFIEIHINDGGKRGIEGWYEGSNTPNNASKAFSESLVSSICKYTGYQNQGVKSEFEHELGSLLILNQANVISTAIECLYIDNQDDIKILNDDSQLDALAKAIADSVKDSIQSSPKVNSSNPASSQAMQTSSRQVFNTVGTPRPQTNTIQSPFNNPPPSFSTNQTQNKPILMDREERKEMIKQMFIKVLGKEPNQNDLNYHLNTGVTETELMKKLVEGEEHQKIVENAKQFKDLTDRITKLTAEIDQLKANNNDSKVMQDSMNRLLEYKNVLIARLHQELARNNIIVQGGHIDSMPNITQKKENVIYPTQKKRTFVDFLIDIFKL